MPYGSNLLLSPTFRNVILNGDMLVAQIGNGLTFPSARNMAVVPTTSLMYANTDMWNLNWNFPGMTAQVNDTQIPDHPLFGVSGNAVCKSIRVTFSQPVLGANDFALLSSPIEGSAFGSIFGRMAALSFWVKSPKVGVHYVTAFNLYTFDSAYIAGYNVNQANTWEQKIIGIDFSSPLGSFDVNAFLQSEFSLAVTFPLACGANHISSVVNRWINIAAPRPFAGPGQQNLLDTVGNDFRVTDVQLEPGLIATPFDRISFPISLQQCQRYYVNNFFYGNNPQGGVLANPNLEYIASNAGIFAHSTNVYFPVAMPLSPSITLYNPGGGAAGRWFNVTKALDSGIPSVQSGHAGFVITNPQIASDALANKIQINWQADARGGAPN